MEVPQPYDSLLYILFQYNVYDNFDFSIPFIYVCIYIKIAKKAKFFDVRQEISKFSLWPTSPTLYQYKCSVSWNCFPKNIMYNTRSSNI